jgi:Peptidase C39 family
MRQVVRSRYSIRTRATAVLVLCSFVPTFLIAEPLQARAQGIQLEKARLDRANAAARYSAPVKPPKAIPAPKSLHENLKPLSLDQAKALRVKSNTRSLSSSYITLLDPVGHLTQRAPQQAAMVSLPRLVTSAPASARPKLTSAFRHLMRGELLLARDEQPEQAISEFRLSSRIANHAGSASRVIRNVCSYDTGLALFYNEQYKEAVTHLSSLLASHEPLANVSRLDATLMLRHARACAGYHADRAKAGITEPTKLSPLCGVEAIAAWLRANGRTYGKQQIRPLCRVTGEGSNLQDLKECANKLGLHSYVFTGDTQGLKNLPKPLVAFVEHDHFVAVTDANDTGVTYLC